MTVSGAPYAFVQARMNSRRLPGKVLADILGRPLLARVVDQLKRCSAIAGLAVVTSDEASDDPIFRFCQTEGLACFRGALNDVTRRFLDAARYFRQSAFVRISGDSPFIDPEIVDRAARLFMAASADLVTNVQVRTFPKGMSVEVIATEALGRIWPEADAGDREHVTRFFYRSPENWRIINFSSGRPWEAVQLSVDEPRDLEIARAIAARLDGPATLDQVMAARERILADA